MLPRSLRQSKPKCNVYHVAWTALIDKIHENWPFSQIYWENASFSKFRSRRENLYRAVISFCVFLLFIFEKYGQNPVDWALWRLQMTKTRPWGFYSNFHSFILWTFEYKWKLSKNGTRNKWVEIWIKTSDSSFCHLETPQSPFDRILLKVFDYEQKRPNKNV